MWQLFIASFCDQTDIEGNGRQQQDKTTTTWQEPRSLSKQVLLKLKNKTFSKNQFVSLGYLIFGHP